MGSAIFVASRLQHLATPSISEQLLPPSLHWAYLFVAERYVVIYLFLANQSCCGMAHSSFPVSFSLPPLTNMTVFFVLEQYGHNAFLIDCLSVGCADQGLPCSLSFSSPAFKRYSKDRRRFKAEYYFVVNATECSFVNGWGA